MKCFAQLNLSIFKTFLSVVVWFVCSVNVMCLANGSAVMPKDSAKNLENVTLFSDSLTDIMDKNLQNHNSTGMLIEFYVFR